MPSFPAVGEDYGRYRVLGELGRGGMGVVFEAEDPVLNRHVALKILNPVFSADPQYRERFAREAATLARLDSPLIVHIYDYGEHDGTVYLVTQMLMGGDLAEHLARYGPLPTHTALGVVADVCEALADAHESGVIHRDVKPSNVFLRQRSGRTSGLLGDFGIATTGDASLTQTGSVVGSTNFMAPERHQGKRADERTDIYAVGCLLWCALSGHAPYQGTDVEVAMKHISADIRQLADDRPQQAAINAVLRRSMAKEPADRYPTAAGLADELHEITARLAPVRRTAPQPAAPDTTNPTPETTNPTPDTTDTTDTTDATPEGRPATPASEPPASSAPPSTAPAPGPPSPPTHPHDATPSSRQGAGGAGPRRRGLAFGATALAAVVVVGGGLAYLLTRGSAPAHGAGTSHDHSPATTTSGGAWKSSTVSRAGMLDDLENSWGYDADTSSCLADRLNAGFPGPKLGSDEFWSDGHLQTTIGKASNDDTAYVDAFLQCNADALWWYWASIPDPTATFNGAAAQKCLGEAATPQQRRTAMTTAVAGPMNPAMPARYQACIKDNTTPTSDG